MKITFYLTGKQYISVEVDDAEAKSIIKNYDSPSCSRIIIHSNEIWHIAKKHIVAIACDVEENKTKLLN